MKNFNRGQINIMTALIGALGIITASAFTSWATANNKLGDVNTQVQVNEEREMLHYQELRKDLSRIEEKLDKLIIQKTLK